MLMKLTFIYWVLATSVPKAEASPNEKSSLKALKQRRHPRQYYQGMPIYPAVEFNQQLPPYIVPRCYYFMPCVAPPCQRRCPNFGRPSPVVPAPGYVGAEIIISPAETKFPATKPPNNIPGK
ncbi:uncharacterized protein LOC115886325 [Sitophilus oryzae]|uniref:Uncharacterized protein LOC115886325 n=1 Tax=Sitophilus oryzae TaxID=7048 RepID=A0A6J2YDN0_SITOR|nr:uncharacterized protein LOC115886325 [Sitophilus oryzae]